MKYTLSVLVENHPGVPSPKCRPVLSPRLQHRFAGGGITEDPTISRMTIVVDGDEHVVEQVEKQLNKVIPCYQGENPVPADTISRTPLSDQGVRSPIGTRGGRRIPGGELCGLGANAGTHRGRHPHHPDHRIFRYHGADRKRWRRCSAPMGSRKSSAPASSPWKRGGPHP